MSEQYDFIIAGFGLSGMTLTYEMSKLSGFEKKKVLVIDADKKETNDRTWSFWSKEQSEYEALATKSWQGCYFYTNQDEELDLDLGDYRYYTVRAIDFYGYIKEKLQAFDNITFHEGIIKQVHDSGAVELEDQSFIGKTVFKSFFNRENLHTTLGDNILWQHFKGWIIETDQPRFDESTFTLMDYRQSDEDLINFFYVLPFSGNRALIEFTEFSKEFYSQEEYDAKIENYLNEVLKIEEYRIVEKEYNAIPMTAHRPKPAKGRVVDMGTIAGHVKPSSGYAFTRILASSQDMALKAMSNELHNSGKNPFIFKLMDRTLLTIFNNYPDQGKAFYFSLFKKIKAFKIFKFLDEKSSWVELFHIHNSVDNKHLFMKAFFKSMLAK
ncbi:MAG TPA: hypothetical protein DCE41_38010 [Cytophagales bacterium]|nr:hypothetical protein [Cytophagales bacterium]HAA20690.1 hypothetical protein [Cytophagales bacterium]HAP65144.1 hypothetical protein [Cytophagales bacterium]